jgi:hypothetical protein
MSNCDLGVTLHVKYTVHPQKVTQKFRTLADAQTYVRQMFGVDLHPDGVIHTPGIKFWVELWSK